MSKIKLKIALQQDKLMAESEDDIKAGHVYNMDEAQKIINSWND